MKTKFLASVLVAGLIVSGAMAQGGRMGGGGAGGGMMRMGAGGYAALLGRADVQKELKLTNEQMLKIQSAMANRQQRPRSGAGAPGGAGGRAGGGAGGAGGGDRPSAADMAKRMAETEAKLLAELTASQKVRAKELLIQRGGNSVILRPDIQADLKLSATQKTKISNLQTKQRDSMQAVFEKMRASGGQPDRNAMRAAVEKSQKTMDAELGKVLTTAQAAQLKKMGGKPFKFAEGR